MNDDDPRHGTTRGYRCGCRCQICRAAKAAYELERKHRAERRYADAIKYLQEREAAR